MTCLASLVAFASLALDPKVELGRRLFMDPTVSRSGRFSCASCHDPEHGFSDARPLSEDENGKTRRHSQPILDLAVNQPLHWDGEFGSLKELLTARLGSQEAALAAARAGRTRRFEEAEEALRKPDKREFQRAIGSLAPPYYGNGPVRAVPTSAERRLAQDGRYDDAFTAAFGVPEPTTERIVAALGAYMLSVRSGQSAFDRDRAGDPRALTAEARRGLALFTGKADCASCHTIEGVRPAFTDRAFHNTGVAFRLAELEFGGDLKGDGGAGEMTFVRADLGKFKTPSLRDVASRAPYMHDGGLATLEEVVRYYDRGGTANRHLDKRVRPLDLTDGDVKDLVAFLEALTSHERPGLGPAPAGPRRARIRVLDLRGKPMKRFEVEVRPAGDRLRGTCFVERQLLVTDSRGYLTLDFPAWTHVRLLAPGHEIHYDWMIPDCVGGMDVMAAPRDQVALKLTGRGDQRANFVARDPRHGVLFTRIRKIDSRSGIYVAARGAVEGPFVATTDDPAWHGARELDLSGGWTDPIDLRPG